ncbi:MAG: molybdenum cofactor guanylyltransferase MobA [Oricola sp.]
MEKSGTENIAGVILAGGRSLRMGGRDKALLPLGGKPMIERVSERLGGQVREIAINANGDPERFAFLGLPIVADEIGDYAGPLAGIQSAMKWAAARNAGYTHIVTVAADTPFFPVDLIARFVDAAPSEMAIVTARSAGGDHPVFALWPLALAGDLEAWLRDGGNLKVRDWIARHDAAAREFSSGENGVDPFFNINTPEDLSEAEAILRGKAA